MVIIAVETVSAGSKPPAVDDSMRTSMGGRCGFGSAPSSTRASSMKFERARSSAVVLKLVNSSGRH